MVHLAKDIFCVIKVKANLFLKLKFDSQLEIQHECNLQDKKHAEES